MLLSITPSITLSVADARIPPKKIDASTLTTIEATRYSTTTSSADPVLSLGFVC